MNLLLSLVQIVLCSAAVSFLNIAVYSAANYYKAIKNRQQDFKTVHHYYSALPNLFPAMLQYCLQCWIIM
jgi:hypothetical protein